MFIIRRSSFILIGVFGVLYANALPFTDSPGNTIATRSTSLQGDLSTSSQDRVLPPKSRDLTLDQNDPIQERGVERRVDLAELQQQLSYAIDEKEHQEQWRDSLVDQLKKEQKNVSPSHNTISNGRVVLPSGKNSTDIFDGLSNMKKISEEIQNRNSEISKLTNEITKLQQDIQAA